MIHLDTPKKFAPLVMQAREVARQVFRPISRQYDRAEHARPVELDMVAAAIHGMNAALGENGAGAAGVRRSGERNPNDNANGSNLSTCLGIMELCWGDVGLLLAMPGQGLGNAAIASVANEEQLARFKGRWAAMAITEPGCGSDSAAIRTSARLDGDHYVLNGEKIYVTSGDRADLVVVWATLDRNLGRAAIKSFVVEKGTPGFELARLEHKLGIRASDTAAFVLKDCRVPKANLLGDPEIQPEKSFAGVMQTFDNTRPLVAAMAVGLAQACLDEITPLLAEAGLSLDADRPLHRQPSAVAELVRLRADHAAARLLTLQAAWMADNGRPNSLEASMAKAKAGRTCVDIALKCVELAGAVGYSEVSMLEKWARDAKILDIFEGTQQIQLLIIARRLLGKSSAELK
ncbi:acyl-CoA dehydrogenase family protein [Aquabacterium parvum]|uniref:acyl-CoA dehydrogenase family protein n=1 Tax=Aquabacterium parvum TaxID=70584 RepID=UPI000718AC10|nr:acyl-CoA dehydrogenase family protein [Aquabacterium parvum]MBU0916499.1 acyl-CoA dehydrogenase family protein [Gammaproteobacteria bacterium]